MKTIERKKQSTMKKIANVQKHLRIANATSGDEAMLHIEKAGKLIEKYGFNKIGSTQ